MTGSNSCAPGTDTYCFHPGLACPESTAQALPFWRCQREEMQDLAPLASSPSADRSLVHLEGQGWLYVPALTGRGRARTLVLSGPACPVFLPLRRSAWDSPACYLPPAVAADSAAPSGLLQGWLKGHRCIAGLQGVWVASLHCDLGRCLCSQPHSAPHDAAPFAATCACTQDLQMAPFWAGNGSAWHWCKVLAPREDGVSALNGKYPLLRAVPCCRPPNIPPVSKTQPWGVGFLILSATPCSATDSPGGHGQVTPGSSLFPPPRV